MLTMEVGPIPCDNLTTQPVILTQSGVIEYPPDVIIEPEITVTVGTVNPLKEALNKTCVDNCADKFEEIGRLLDNRNALLAKVRINLVVKITCEILTR